MIERLVWVDEICKQVLARFSAARSLAGAKSLQEVVELQTNLARSFLETYMSEVGKLSETVSASVKDSMKPLNDRVTDVVERLQAAR